MRILDVAPPTITSGDRPGPDRPMGRWPAELYVAIEGVEYSAPHWDASPAIYTWDDPDGEPDWDELGDEEVIFTDAICWLQGLTIDTGVPDATTRYTAASLNATLDNRDGRWSRYSPSGSLVFHPPGRQIKVWAEIDGVPWWLFTGRISSWKEVGTSVELEAFDSFTELNVKLGEWNVGSAGDTPKARINAILAMIGWTWPHDLKIDVGDITCLARATENSPLEEMQAVAESDAGVFLIDADGAIGYGDRRWIRGRDDQPRPPKVLSGNVAGADAVVWDLVTNVSDEILTNFVTLANDATPQLTVTARNLVSEGRYGTFTFPENRTEDLWQTAIQGQAVAEYLIDLRDDPNLHIESASFFLHDQRHDLWLLAINLRRGDMVRFIQDTFANDGSTLRLDLDLITSGIRHDITPETWVVTIATTPTVGSRYVGNWDTTIYAWDTDDAFNVWAH